MTLTPRIAADIIGKRLGMTPGAAAPLVTMSIPEALKLTARKIAADPVTRALLVTDPAATKVVIGANGKVNLVTAYGSFLILKEFLEHGQMYLLPTASFATSAVDVGQDTITLANQRVAVGDRIQFTTTGSLPSGLALATDYWVNTYDPTTGAFSVSATVQLGSKLDLTTQGSGTHTVSVQESADFPLQKLAGPDVAPLPRYLDVMYRYYYIQGDTLQVLPRSTTGQVSFAVPYIPGTLALLPDSTEAEAIFLDTLFNLVSNNQQGAK